MPDQSFQRPQRPFPQDDRLPPLPWPRNKFPNILLTTAVLVGFGMLAILIRKVWRAPLRKPGLIAVMTDDGAIAVAAFEFPGESDAPAGQLVRVRTVLEPEPKHSHRRLWLRGDESLLAADVYETIPGGEHDLLVFLWDVASGRRLFEVSDNFVPNQSWRCDDPVAPEMLRLEQQDRDELWEQEKAEQGEDYPRTILNGHLDGGTQQGTLEIAGWTMDGRLAVTGSCPWRIEDTNQQVPFERQTDNNQSWWGIIGPAPTGTGWAYDIQGLGALPAAYPLRPLPLPTKVLTLAKAQPWHEHGTLSVDGVAQTEDWLNGRVTGFDGPYRG